MKPQDTMQQHAILRQSGIARAFDTVAEAAPQVSAILAATARSQAQPERLVMTDARTATGRPAPGGRGAVPGCAEGSNVPASRRGTRRRNGGP